MHTYIVVYINVYISLIIKKTILFNMYYHYSMIIDAIPSMEEISFLLKGKIKDRLKKKIKDLILKRNDQIEISF